MRRLWISFLSFFIIAAVLPVLAFGENTESSAWKEFYVSAGAPAGGNGTKSSPFATVEQARDAVRAVSDGMQGDIIVNIGPGNYYLENTIDFTSVDSGKNGYRVIYRGEGQPVLSGGRTISGFSPVPGSANLWQAKAEGFERIRELYVGGRKADIASSEHDMVGTNIYQAPGSRYSSDGFYVSKKDLGIYENAEDIEMKWAQGWVTAICHVDSILQDPAKADQVIVKMQQSWWDIQTVTGGMYGLGAKFNRPFVVQNAMELLDRPGEFYYNRKTQMLYYMPREGENMVQAQVIAPKLEKLVRVTGDTNGDKAKNISFEGIKFAHTTWHYPGEAGILLYQQQKLNQYTDFFDYIPGAIEVNRGDGIAFEDNTFFGFASSGLVLENAVENTVVNGNAFSDIGNAGIVSGRAYHGGNDGIVNSSKNNRPSETAQWNLINGSERLTASYYGPDQDHTLSAVLGSQFWVDSEKYPYGVTWSGDPDAPAQGERTWLRYDFDKPYSIDKIVLAFDPAAVSKPQRSGFEILLSNDRTFADYETIAVQTSPADHVAAYPVNTKEKYRYMMIRTTDATSFALSGAWAFTPDVKLEAVAQINKNNTVSNNYLTRVDDTIYGGGGISGNYNEALSILHNEIYEVPYSGIASGWGWNMTNRGTKNNNISHNLIVDACQYLSDGGGIYTLSDQNGSKVTNNYVKNLFTGNASFYPDEGSSNSTWDNNVQEDAFLNWHVWTDTIQNNTMSNTYGTHDAVRYRGVNNQFDPVKVFLPGQPGEEAYTVIQNAGLEPGYEKLRERVPAGKLRLPDERSRYLDILEGGLIDTNILSLNKVAENVLNNGSFGNLPGQYPIKFRYQLQTAYENMNSAGMADKLERMIELRNVINDTSSAFYRMDLKDMLAFCQSALENAKVSVDGEDLSDAVCIKILNGAVTGRVLDTYPAQSVQEFATEFKAMKQEAETAKTDAEQLRLVIRLEEAYSKFANAKYDAGIAYVHAAAATRTEIDRDSHTATLYVPFGTDLSSVKLEVTPSGSAIIAAQTDKADLTKDFKLPVYCKEAQRYEFWTVRAVEGDPEQADGWATFSAQENCVTAMPSGGTLLTAGKVPYMNKLAAQDGETLQIKFRPITSNDVNSFSVLFGANRSDVKTNCMNLGDSRLQIDVSGNAGTLYEVISGVKTKLTAVAFPVKYNAENTLELKLSRQDGRTQAVVTLNGAVVANTFTNLNYAGGYAGFDNSDFGIEIVNFKKY
ncbi:right-handed parallel beta-helix repeat-containing protein [Congzhengia minquanensis]|uniref:GH141-like insertion domain-containing protein n=1 Tax=Congzhengia minquanensis TaxID=2763657 RepID=A0A926DM47_9FIRM|nr:right-handed parallel beta-helix repeat-containing protein [Congzhengia minquanensis]MBC8539744.1 hypothetical protein [Congzhengia minquanensis]